MALPATPESFQIRAARYSAVQRRTIAAALELFADHRTAGTSFQMIADAVGVTKAAIYHQFGTKEAIIVAVTEVELARLEEACDRATSPDDLLERVIDVAVERRRAISMLQSDPAVVRFLGVDEQSQQLWERMFGTLIGDRTEPRQQVRAAVLSTAIGAVAHPFLAQLDNDTLRTELLATTRRFLARG